jgi:hypothetical protein
MHGDEGGHGRIDNTLRDVLRVDPDGVGIHVMSNVADQHQTAPGQRQFAAGGLRDLPELVGVDKGDADRALR